MIEDNKRQDTVMFCGAHEIFEAPRYSVFLTHSIFHIHMSNTKRSLKIYMILLARALESAITSLQSWQKCRRNKAYYVEH